MSDTVSSPDPNNPANYPASQQVGVVAPLIAQVTGGNPGNTVAAVQGAVKTDNDVFGRIFKGVQEAATQLSAAFNAGKASSSPQDIATQVTNLANQKAAAIVQRGQAGANIAGMDELHQADAARAVATDAVRLGLDPNNPDAIAGMKSVADNAAQVFQATGDLARMRQVGFFDNPAAYLLNHIIRIPMAEDRAQESLISTKEAQEAISSQTKALQDRTVVDAAINSVHTTDRAAEIYKQAIGATIAAGIDPLEKAQQIKISAYELGVAQQNAATARMNEGINAQRLEIEKQKLPGELALKDAQLAAYGDQHAAAIESMKSATDLRRQEIADKVKKDTTNTELLSAVNGTIRSFGGTGTITDFSRVPKPQLDALLDVHNNLENFKSIGQGPVESLALLKRAGIPLNNIPASQIPTLNSIDQMVIEGVKQVDAAQLGQATKLSPQEKEQQVSAYVQTQIAKEQNNVSASNKFYVMPSVGTVVNQDWAKSNPILQAMRPMSLDGSGKPIQRNLDGSLLINTAVGLLNEGKITENQAVDALADIGKNILHDTQQAGGFLRYSIPYNPNKFGVLFAKSGAHLGTNNVSVDLLNRADALMKLRMQAAGTKSMDFYDPNSDVNLMMRGVH